MTQPLQFWHVLKGSTVAPARGDDNRYQGDKVVRIIGPVGYSHRPPMTDVPTGLFLPVWRRYTHDPVEELADFVFLSETQQLINETALANGWHLDTYTSNRRKFHEYRRGEDYMWVRYDSKGNVWRCRRVDPKDAQPSGKAQFKHRVLTYLSRPDPAVVDTAEYQGADRE